MQLAPIVSRLQSQVTTLKKVGMAAEFDAARKDVRPVPPAAFVLPLRESAGRNELENAISQRVTAQFAVVYCAQNLRDARGGQAHEDLDAVRAAGKTALLGWQPDVDHDPCEYVGGELLGLQGPFVWWQDVFVTAFYMRSV